MDYLPIFADLKQRPVLVVGGGEVAARKIDLLLRAGAQVRIVAQALSPELEQRKQAAEVSWLAQAFLPEQLDDVFTISLNAPLFSPRLSTVRRLW